MYHFNKYSKFFPNELSQASFMFANWYIIYSHEDFTAFGNSHENRNIKTFFYSHVTS